MLRYKKTISLFLIIVVFLFLRLYHLPESLNYGADQGMTLLEIYNLYQTKKFTLIAQTGSSLTVFGRYFYTGSFMYYLFMPILLITRWNPLSISYFLILVQLAVLLLLYHALAKIYKKSATPLYFSLLYTFFPMMVDYSRFIWAPNLLIPVAGIVLSLLLGLSTKKSNSFLVLLTGFFLGLGLQIHYSFFLVILISIFWLLIGKKLNLSAIFLLLLGFIIGFSPLILFELRHNFYNLRTFIFYITTKTGSNQRIMSFSWHYLLCLWPFVFLFIAKLLSALKRVASWFATFLVLLFIGVSVTEILPFPKSGFTMPEGWNYAGVQKASAIILHENRKKYNIVDLLTGDTRAMGLRSLLTFAGKPPLGVVEYPETKALFIYSKVPIEKLLRGKLWEMDVVKPVKLVKTWHLQNGIYLYLLEKTATVVLQ